MAEREDYKVGSVIMTSEQTAYAVKRVFDCYELPHITAFDAVFPIYGFVRAAIFGTHAAILGHVKPWVGPSVMLICRMRHCEGAVMLIDLTGAAQTTAS